MRIALVKPDWRISGGFELVVDRVSADLRGAGHGVQQVTVDATVLERQIYGLPVGDAAWQAAPEWFTHMALLERFREVDLSDYDLVVSTQPPSYAVRHPKHLALFYHHARAFYDLADVWVAAGRAPAGVHALAASMVRSAEAEDFRGVTHFLAGSGRIAERLRQFQGPDLGISLYEAAAPEVPDVDELAFEHVLCVSRHEFTKRTELVVQALALLPREEGVLVGAGGRLPFVRELAGRLGSGGVDPASLGPEDLWLNLGLAAGAPTGRHERIRVAGRVPDEERDAQYRSALCVVAPAYDEDDGLTVLEAMAYGKPVIVCRDGGGLTALVRDGENGFVVEPHGAAIAEALARFAADPSMARRMGKAGREAVSDRTVSRARGQLLAAVELTAGSAP